MLLTSAVRATGALLLHLTMIVSSQLQGPARLDLRGQQRFSQQNIQRLHQLQLVKNRILEGLNLDKVPSHRSDRNETKVSQFTTDANRPDSQQEHTVILFSESSVTNDEKLTQDLISFRLRTNNSADIQSVNLFIRLRRHRKQRGAGKMSDDASTTDRQGDERKEARLGEKRSRRRRRRFRGRKVKVIVHRIDDVTMRKRRLAAPRVRIAKAKWLNIRLDPEKVASFVRGEGRTLLLKLSCKKCRNFVDLDLVHKKRRSCRKRGRGVRQVRKLNKHRPFLVIKSNTPLVSSSASSPSPATAPAKPPRSAATKRLTRSSAERRNQNVSATVTSFTSGPTSLSSSQYLPQNHEQGHPTSPKNERTDHVSTSSTLQSRSHLTSPRWYSPHSANPELTKPFFFGRSSLSASDVVGAQQAKAPVTIRHRLQPPLLSGSPSVVPTSTTLAPLYDIPQRVSVLNMSLPRIFTPSSSDRNRTSREGLFPSVPHPPIHVSSLPSTPRSSNPAGTRHELVLGQSVKTNLHIFNSKKPPEISTVIPHKTSQPTSTAKPVLLQLSPAAPSSTDSNQVETSTWSFLSAPSWLPSFLAMNEKQRAESLAHAPYYNRARLSPAVEGAHRDK